MKFLGTLGEIYPSDFLKEGQEPRSNKIELKLMLDDNGTARLEKTAPLDKMFGLYWYRSSINATMRNELQNIVQSITSVIKLKENDLWIDVACFPENNFINTKNGNVDIKDIKINDEVLSHDGQYHKVIKLFNRYFEGEFVSLKLKGLNTNTIMTFNHPVLTKRGYVEAKNLSIKDEISLRAGIVENNEEYLDLYQLLLICHDYKINDLNNGFIQSASNGLKNKLPRFIKIDNDLARIFGYYIGEGSGCGGSGLQFAFSLKEMEKAENVAAYFKSIFNIDVEIKSYRDDVIVARLNSRPLSSIFKHLFGHGAKNKKIPKEMFNKNILPTFIEALWFTDGHFTLHKNCRGKCEKRYIYSSVSKNLILELRNLLEVLGIICSIQCVKNNRGFSVVDGTIYRLTVERKLSVSLLENLFIGNIIIPTTQERFVKILDIKKTNEKHIVYNFEVENSNSYICNGITVHNCNDGCLLSFVPKTLLRIGIDPADDTYKVEAEKHANLIIQDYFSAEVFQKSQFGSLKAKVITSIAMFYDLEHPETFIKDIDKVLDDNGLWVMQLSYTPLMIEQLAFDNILHEHMYYYSLFNLKLLLENNGFKIVDCQLNDINGGSFRVYIMKQSANEKIFSSQPYRDVCNFRIASLLKYEKTLNLTSIDMWKDFFNRIDQLKEKTVSFIKQEKAKGKRVWGYAASTKGNTFLQYFGLNNTLIDKIAERSVYKWGLKTIGTNIPICSEDEMRKAKPDYLLILPWHFINEFIEREKELLQSGTKFIIPCPKFEIIGL